MNPLQYIHALEHHAYFIHSFKDAAQHLKEFLKEKFKIGHDRNPDFFHEKFESLGIEDSRRIKELHLSKSFSKDGKKIFIIEASNITNEAQNALLKIFEEPNENSHFFLVMPSSHALLPTLKSRLYILKSQNHEVLDQDLFNEVEKFLKLSKKDKIAYVDDIAKDISDEKLDKSNAQEFLAALEVVLYKQKGIETANTLKAILKARDYLNDRSASVKQLLEYVALSL